MLRRTFLGLIFLPFFWRRDKKCPRLGVRIKLLEAKLEWTDMAVAGYEYRVNGGTPVDVGSVLSTVVTGLATATSYDFEVRAYDGLGQYSDWSPVVTASTGAATLPIDMANLLIWLRNGTGLYQDAAMTTPAAHGDPVGAWADQSGNARHRTQSTGGNKPTASQVNSQLSVHFDATNDDLRGASSLTLKPMTFFCLYTPDSFITGSKLLGTSVSSGLSIDVPAGADKFVRLVKAGVAAIASATVPLVLEEPNRIIVTYSASGAYSFYINGVLAGSGTSDYAISPADPELGDTIGGQELEGLIGDWGIFGDVKTVGEIAILDAYLESLVGERSIENFSGEEGALLVEDFTGMSGWTGTGFSVESRPTYVTFDPSPYKIEPTPATTDSRGCREAHWMYVDGVYYQFYGGTNVTNWQVHLATSDDSITWDKFGPIGIGLSKTNNPADGTWGARDMLYAERRSGTWHLHLICAPNVSGGIPNEPYHSDVWTLDGDPTDDDWTFIRETFTLGPTTFDDNGSYFSAIYFDGATTYYVFYGAKGAASGEWDVGYATGASPDGPFTKHGKIISDALKGDPENPKIWWSAKLNRWVLLVNQVNYALGLTDINSAFFSESLTDWDDCVRSDIQTRHDTTSTMDAFYAVGIASPIYGDNGLPIISSLGNISFTFDGDPDVFATQHFDRNIKFGGLEASTHRMKVDAFGTTHEVVHAMDYGNFVATFVIEMWDAEVGGGAWFKFRDEYKAYFPAGDNAEIQRNDVAIATGTGYDTFAESEYIQYRVKVVAYEGMIRLYFNGELQADSHDIGPLTGTEIGFGAEGVKCAVRQFTMNTGTYFTLNGLDAGAVVVAYGPGGHVPMATGTADANGTLELTPPHYPIERLVINGAAQDIVIYGGEVVSL